MVDMSLPASPQAVPGLPENFTPIVFEGFEGLNTLPSRVALRDGELFWCDGFMPIAKNTLRSMPGVSASLYTVPVGRTIICFKFFNISTGLYFITFLDDGSAEIAQYNSGTGVWNVIIPSSTLGAGTFAIGTNATYTNPYAVQWGSQYLLIVAANGYFIYDGTAFYKGLAATATLAPVITILNGGTGYPTAAGAVTATVAGGTGTGATFSVTVDPTSTSIVSVQITNPGSGYTVTDGIGGVVELILGVAGLSSSTGPAGTHYPLIFTNAAGDTTGSGAAGYYTLSGTGVNAYVNNLVITSPGSKYTLPPTISFGQVSSQPNFFTTPTATCVLGISPGYYQATLPLIFTASTGGGASAVARIMPLGISGSSIETYAQRVWVGNNNKIFFTAPSSVSDFGTPDGGGVITSADSFLKTSYVNLFQSNGFLYTLADSSVNYISGVGTTATGTVVTTTYSNTNADPQIGTFARDSCQTFGRKVVFLSTDGLHVVNGGVVQKISDELDGIFSGFNAATWTTYAPSSAQAIIWGQHCYMVLLPLTNPSTTNIPVTFVGNGTTATITYASLPVVPPVGSYINLTGFSYSSFVNGSYKILTSTSYGQITVASTYVGTPPGSGIASFMSYSLAIWNGKKWWTSPQDQTPAWGGGSLTFITTFEFSSNVVAYGTDGSHIYALFTNYATTYLPKVVSSKLYDTPSYMMNKRTVRMLGLVQQTNTSAPNLTIGLDNANSSNLYSTSTLTDPRWTNTGQKWFTMNADQQGYMLGFTIYTSEPNITLESFTMVNQQFNLEI